MRKTGELMSGMGLMSSCIQYTIIHLASLHGCLCKVFIRKEILGRKATARCTKASDQTVIKRMRINDIRTLNEGSTMCMYGMN
jgi:hypothetical protein